MNTATFPLLDAQQLQQDISSRLTGHSVNIRYLGSCQSTNMECMRLAQHVSVVIAEQQTSGRGRRGKVWVSPASDNIYCSIGLNKTMLAEYIGLISLQVGVCISQVLLAQGYSGLSLKWPNDILLQGKKLGGVLIETRMNALNEFYLVIGFGLNAHLHDSVLKDIDRPAIGLNQVSDEAVNRQTLLPQLISAIVDSVTVFQLEHIPDLIRDFAALDSYMGKQVVILSGEERITGIYHGLEKTGQIQIQTEQGLQTFAAAEISLRAPEHVADR